MLGQSKELNFDVMKRLREKSKGSGIVAQLVLCLLLMYTHVYTCG